MTHVKLVNKKSGMPQIVTKQTYANIKAEMPKLAKQLEYMHDCDENGNKEQDIIASTAPSFADQEKIEAIKKELEDEQKVTKAKKSGKQS